jgi:uncharacterized membrane protein (DUF485 family)
VLAEKEGKTSKRKAVQQDSHTWMSEHPKFQELVRRRSRFAWTLSIIMLLVYQGFILLVAFDKGFLATPISEGSVTTLGIPIGICVIIFAFLLTGIYVWVANSRYDEINRQLIKEVTAK